MEKERDAHVDRLKEVIDYEMGNMSEVTPTPQLNLPDIQEIKCYEPVNKDPYWLFVCKEKHRYHGGCPQCGSISYSSQGYFDNARLVHDVTVGIKQVDIFLFAKRYRCKDCGTSFSHPFDSVIERRQMTNRLYEYIRQESFRKSFTAVAIDHGISDTEVTNIFDEYAIELENAREEIIAPRVLGIDEKHIQKNMRGIFVDIDTGKLLEMTASNDKEIVIKTIMSMKDYDKNIKIVTMDMANGYRSDVQFLLPHATIIVDKYHVIQDLYRKIATIKGSIIRRIGEEVKAEPEGAEKTRKQALLNLLYRNPYLFKFGEEKLSEKKARLALMADVCETFPEFNHLRLLKEGFERIYDNAHNKESADKLLTEWEELVPPKKGKETIKEWEMKTKEWESKYHVRAKLFAEIQEFQTAMNRWRTEFLNYFDVDCYVTNAAAEGQNRFVQHLNEVGSGYGFKRLRARVLFYHAAARETRYSAKEFRKNLKYSSFMKGEYGFLDVLDIHSVREDIEKISIVSEVIGDALPPFSIYDAKEHPLFSDFHDDDLSNVLYA